MTRRKRAVRDDPDQFEDSEERNEVARKYVKAEIDNETAQNPDSSFPAVILSGFTWNMDVDARISRALEIYQPIFLEVSLELPAHEKLAIKNRHGIQTDFMKVVCRSAEDQDKMVKELNHARYTWTSPYLEVKKLEVGSKNNGKREEHNHSIVAPKLHPEQERRKAQAKVWIKLAEAVTNARTHLFGDDLDTFEALIAKPVPGINPMDRVNSWICGGGPVSQPQKMNAGVQRVKVEEPRGGDEENKNITMGDEMAITIDDEMAYMGVTFGRTDLTPWW